MDMPMDRLNNPHTNMGLVERRLSLATGLVTLAYLVVRQPRTAISLPLLLEAGYMLYRGFTGHCMVYHALDIDRSYGHDTWQGKDRTAQRKWESEIDAVEVASEDSFPASDPRGWVSSGRIE